MVLVKTCGVWILQFQSYQLSDVISCAPFPFFRCLLKLNLDPFFSCKSVYLKHPSNHLKARNFRAQNHPHRIHGAAIYGVPCIPSIYPLYVSIFLPAPAGSVMGSKTKAQRGSAVLRAAVAWGTRAAAPSRWSRCRDSDLELRGAAHHRVPWRKSGWSRLMTYWCVLRREWMGCWGLLGWLLIVIVCYWLLLWIIPENSLRLAPVRWFCAGGGSTSILAELAGNFRWLRSVW